VQAVDSTRRAIEAGLLTCGPAALLEAILSGVADAVAEVMAAQVQDLDEIEDDLLACRGTEDSRKLAVIRLRGVHLHRQLSGLRVMFHRIERESTDRLPQILIDAAARIAQRLDALDSDVVSIQQQARLLQDESGARLASQINRQLYVLSLIAALFLPPSVVAGIFGMNVGGLPMIESPYGFVIAMLLLAVSPVLVYLAFSISGILHR
jgi:magnesium transporter/zinc transporter